jgi:hypothetical protein
VNGAGYNTPVTIEIAAQAFDPDGTVSQVDFYQGVTLLGTATTSPYTFTWNDVLSGNYTLTARVSDNLGANTTSRPVNITVSGGR